jgi:carbon-monoxide dehydrogenase medium subunit
MIPSAFEYVRASSVDEALGLIGNGGGAKVLAGGQSILPLMKLRLARPTTLVDIGRLGELRGVQRRDDGFAVGALTTYAELIDSPLMEIGALADALPTIGDVQVRNRGTIGGAVAHADPASDLPACLVALDATVVARSRAGGERTIPIADFLTGAFTTGLRDDEILTEVRIPAPPAGAGSAYANLEQKASGYAIVGVAAVVSGGTARVGITGVADHAYRAVAVEAAYGQGAAAAAEHATDGVTVNGDIHADAEYRAAMARVYTRRALEAAAGRAG